MNQKAHLTQTDGDHSLRFAGPDLLDYSMIFDISGGVYGGERLKSESAYHPCCGTLERNASIFGIHKRWCNSIIQSKPSTHSGANRPSMLNIIDEEIYLP